MSTLPQTKKRTGAFVSTYLILGQGPDILLLLKKNTGFCDGRYGLVSGHVEDGESASAAMLFYMTEEGQEGRNAFVQKRKPNFKQFKRKP